MTRAFVSAVCALGLVACGGTPPRADMTAPGDLSASTGDLFRSICGQPGDSGNSLGVGKYCGGGEADCATNSMAQICSSIGNDPRMPSQDTFFCTFTCDPTSPPGYCGDGASCACAQQGCACAPDSCIPPDLGGS